MNKLHWSNLLLFLLIIGTVPMLSAQQKSWKQLKKDAENYEKQGDLMRAAIYYESAFNLKTSNLELAYKAGDCFLKIRDYENAVTNLKVVSKEYKNSKFIKPGYKYALALKQKGDYEEAMKAFSSFNSNYSGEDKAALSERIKAEIQGCNLALETKENVNAKVSVALLSPAVNSDKDDFAAIPFGNDQLYFSSNVAQDGSAKVYRMRKGGKDWTGRVLFEPSKASKEHFANGSFTPDGNRFYFSKCVETTGGNSRCDLYVIVKDNGNWSSAVKLPNYINPNGASTTHPWVVVENEKEILYFASNREGGKGGFDIWYSSRMLKSKGNNFTLPKNLGPNINSSADEITPFYNLQTGTLYFSSNGHISTGGLDIFKSKGAKTKWELAQNMGFPINSAADDLYYVESAALGGGFFTSNRVFNTKVATTNDDIYYFGLDQHELTVKGRIYAENDPDKVPLKDVNVQLFQWVNGAEELVEDRMLAEGEYKFTLKGNKHYLVVINAEGFDQASFKMATHDIGHAETRVNDIAMRDPNALVEKPKVEEEDPYYVIVPERFNAPDNAYVLPMQAIDAESQEVYEEGSKPYEAFLEIQNIAEEAQDRQVYWNEEGEIVGVEKEVIVNKDPVTPKVDPDPPVVINTHHEHYDTSKETEAEEGTSYVIQVAAVRTYKSYKYKQLEKGPMSDYKLDFETIELNITRVLVIPETPNDDGTIGFKKKAQALNVLYHILNHTRFDRAFVVEYKGKERVGKGFRGLDEEDEVQ